jgi:uncharacterized membrane protein
MRSLKFSVDYEIKKYYSLIALFCAQTEALWHILSRNNVLIAESVNLSVQLMLSGKMQTRGLLMLINALNAEYARQYVLFKQLNLQNKV